MNLGIKCKCKTCHSFAAICLLRIFDQMIQTIRSNFWVSPKTSVCKRYVHNFQTTLYILNWRFSLLNYYCSKEVFFFINTSCCMIGNYISYYTWTASQIVWRTLRLPFFSVRQRRRTQSKQKETFVLTKVELCAIILSSLKLKLHSFWKSFETCTKLLVKLLSLSVCFFKKFTYIHDYESLFKFLEI